jgi:hypothetical protein
VRSRRASGHGRSVNAVIFARYPQLAIDLLGILKDDDSRYVQESVVNAQWDIWRKHPGRVLEA